VISEEAQHWAAQRGSPTLIVEVDPAIGLTSDIDKRLEERATTSLGKVTGGPGQGSSLPFRSSADTGSTSTASFTNR
jgi:hypothetical protein